MTIDEEYPSMRSAFAIPTLKSLGISSSTKEATYLCGNSLGLMPLQTKDYLNAELNCWAGKGVEGHFDHPKTSWVKIDLPVVPLLAGLVGGSEKEVGVMGTLTGNLNALLSVFYKPKGKKSKILFDKGAFPSDYYAFLNQVKLHQNDIVGEGNQLVAEEYLLQLEPKKGEYTLNTADILKAIDENHEDIALVCLPGIQYYTGQLFEIQKITSHAKKYGLTVGWDLAHAAGNVTLELHKWDVDFAVWCTYKYLNAGPGGIGGYFINEKYSTDTSLPRVAGWWGNNDAERFQMKEVFQPIESALGFRQSNPSVLDVVSLQSSLDVIKSVKGNTADSMVFLREKSIKLTNLLEQTLKNSAFYVAPEKGPVEEVAFTIITPSDPNQRGAQLSLLFFPLVAEKNTMEAVFEKLRNQGVIGDERRPNVIRLAPTPLYNTEQDVIYACEQLEKALKSLK